MTTVSLVSPQAALRQLPGNKVPAMAVMVQSLMRSSVDASVVLRDPTGEASTGGDPGMRSSSPGQG